MWSARVTIEQDVTLQSISPICELIESVTEKVPSFLNGMARSAPYGGGFDEIQAEAGSLAFILIPPPHGPGFVELFFGVTHKPM